MLYQIAPNKSIATKQIPHKISRQGKMITKNAETNIASLSCFSRFSDCMFSLNSFSFSGSGFLTILKNFIWSCTP